MSFTLHLPLYQSPGIHHKFQRCVLPLPTTIPGYFELKTQYTRILYNLLMLNVHVYCPTQPRFPKFRRYVHFYCKAFSFMP